MTANPTDYLENKFYRQLIGSHQGWLKHFNNVYVNAWDKLFTKSNSEAAICEAATRRLLQELEVYIEPCPLRGSDRNPDFKCQRDGKLFYVDATCVMKDTATRKTGLTDLPKKDGKAFGYSLLTNTYFNKAVSKVSQFENLNAPCMIVIGTLHFQGGALCFGKRSAEEILTGKTGISMKINKLTGGAVGENYNSTLLEAALFLEPRIIFCDEPLIRPKRQTVSAVLLCPFGTHPVEYLGVLHPMPNHVFGRELFPSIEFCHLKEGWEKGTFTTEWI